MTVIDFFDFLKNNLECSERKKPRLWTAHRNFEHFLCFRIINRVYITYVDIFLNNVMVSDLLTVVRVPRKENINWL